MVCHFLERNPCMTWVHPIVVCSMIASWTTCVYLMGMMLRHKRVSRHFSKVGMAEGATIHCPTRSVNIWWNGLRSRVLPFFFEPCKCRFSLFVEWDIGVGVFVLLCPLNSTDRCRCPLSSSIDLTYAVCVHQLVECCR